jgi:hypothetical protein
MKFNYGSNDELNVPVKLFSFSSFENKTVAVSDGLGIFSIMDSGDDFNSVETNSNIDFEITNGKIIFDKIVDEITIYNLSGKLITKKRNLKDIFLSDLTKGLIIVNARSGLENKVIKIIN